MDSIYEPREFRATDYIKATEYLSKYVKLIKPINALPDSSSSDDIEQEIFKLMDVPLSDTQTKNLTACCSGKSLDVPGELFLPNIGEILLNMRLYSPEPIPEAAKKLHTIKNQMKRLELLATTAESSEKYVANLKYRSETLVEENVVGGTKDLIESQAIVYVIRLYEPFRHHPGCRINAGPRFSHSILVIGSNTIADFRDKILCPSDLGVSTDISAVPHVAEDPLAIPMAKEKYKSSFVYIEGVFYNDFRGNDCIDYSEVVREWTSQKKHIGPFETAKMDEVCFNDLKIRMGYPNVFLHQGNCEHLFVFSDVRLLHAKDSFYSEDYPMFKTIAMRKSRYCMMCGAVVARIIVTHCDRLPSDPNYLCEVCFRSYLYLDGKKLGHFQAFLFYDNSPVL